MSITGERRATDPDTSGAPQAAGGEPGFDRSPPQDIAAEQCVLGGMLLSKDAIADVVEILRGQDFYRPAHATIFEVILDLYGRGEPADAITVAAALADSKELGRVGGAPYLHTVMASVPTAANSAYYARIVAERAVLRRLIEAGTRIVQLGFGSAAGGGRDIDDLVDLAQQTVYDVTERRVSDDFAVLSDLLQPTLDEIEAVGAQGGVMTGIPTGFADLDRLLNGLHPGQLIIVAGRPGLGKSTAAMDFARSASVRHNLASAIFSLEMSKVEIVMRLLAAEARVPLHVLRSGQLSDDDWTKLARRMGEISEAPLFVDDTPNMNLMEIRAKARRLRQRNDLKLVVVDYLQLMTSPRRVESRQQEVAELSRGLKLLAKEIDCPVVAVSQLNRGPEQRNDKRPQLSDLRESGCLTASTRVIRADTNAEVTLGDLLASGQRNVPVWALDERMKYVARTMTHVFPSGRREVFRLRLASGRTIEATGNHPFRTYDGWRPLGQVRPGDRLAVARHIPPPLDIGPWPDADVITLAHLLADRSPVPPQAVSLAGPGGHPAGPERTGLAPHPRYIPDDAFALPKSQVALLLHHVWSTGGSVSVAPEGRTGHISFGSTSQRLVEGLSLLLMRFGIASRLAAEDPSAPCTRYTLDISGRDDQLRFLRQVGVHGEHAGAAARLLAVLDSGARGRAIVDTVPREVWDRVRRVLLERETPAREAAGHPGAPRGRADRGTGLPGGDGLSRVAAVLADADLELLATNDVHWDEVASIEPLGEQDVYDATVLRAHNFVANGISVHNSIEQDADVVILLHRDDYYDRESPRAGEADFIVAKHRNGPTDTVTVAAQLHLSRFVDMAVV